MSYPPRSHLGYLDQIRREEAEKLLDDSKFRFTLESAKRILTLADKGFVNNEYVLTMAAQAVREAAMTGLEKFRMETIAYNLKTQQWEKLDKGDWSKYEYQYLKPKQIK